MIKIFAGSGDAIMTPRTSAQHLEVVHRYRRIPQVGRVTILANVGGRDMVKSLTGRGHAVMAVATTLGFNILMIEIRRYPTGRTVAVITLRRGG